MSGSMLLAPFKAPCSILWRATYHRALRYGGVRTLVEGLLAHGSPTLAAV